MVGGYTRPREIFVVKMRQRLPPFGIAEISLVDADDLRAALLEAFPKNHPPSPKEPGLLANVTAIDAAARAQVRRLADARVTELDRIQHDLETVATHALAIIETLRPDLTLAEPATIVERVTGAEAPSTSAVSAIEGGARGAGFEQPDQALNEALKEIANLHFWERGAADAFATGLKARQHTGRPAARHDPVAAALAAVNDDPAAAEQAEERSRRRSPVHPGAGVDLGLVVITSYAALTRRSVGVSRSSTTMKAAGGMLSGPLVRFVLAIFRRIRLRMAQEPTLNPYGTARAFNPTGSTIGAWARAYKQEIERT